MSDEKKIGGVIPVLVTPFDDSEEIVHEDIARQVEAAVVFGVDAVCLPAYASEFYKLSRGERLAVVKTAVEAAKGRIRIIGQSNHPSARLAADLARENRDNGADLISFAIPRQFGATEEDLLSYCARICRSVEAPVLIQDFNPGGATAGPEFCRNLVDRCPNFQYIKLEEPLLGPKLRAIHEATSERVWVFEGWGGMYVPELFEYGIKGTMPGLGHADVMARMWDAGVSGDVDGALDLFQGLLPQVLFSLQDMEFYLTVEKQLQAARGIIRHTRVRELTYGPDDEALRHAERLNARVLELVERMGMKTRPLE